MEPHPLWLVVHCHWDCRVLSLIQCSALKSKYGPTRRRLVQLGLVVLGIALGSLASGWKPNYAHAYTRRDIVTSAQAVIGESGWTAYRRGEDLAIVGVHLYRQSLPANRGRTLTQVTRAYSSALNGHRPWVLALGRPGWPRGLPTRHRTHWEATLARVEAFLRGELENPCEVATHYGSRHDGPPAPGYRRVCRGMGFRSHFWAKPGR